MGRLRKGRYYQPRITWGKEEKAQGVGATKKTCEMVRPSTHQKALLARLLPKDGELRPGKKKPVSGKKKKAPTGKSNRMEMG